MQGSRLATGEARRGTCGDPPIRHGSCRDTLPSGEGGLRTFSWLRALGRGSPTVAPLRVRVACFAIGVRGGDLLRRPTEATLAPLAMGRVCKQQRVQEPAPAPVALIRSERELWDNAAGVRGRQPRIGVQGVNAPLGALHDRVAVRPLRTVTPACAARPPRAVPAQVAAQPHARVL